MSSDRRKDGRTPFDARTASLELGFLGNADGSCLISTGRTRVICSATAVEGTPSFLHQGTGWLTATYNMLPAATNTRRDRPGLRENGRSVEIKRLIGRALRAAVNLRHLSPYTMWIDCDVIEADGGTRTAAITGGYVALSLACRNLLDHNKIRRSPLKRQIAAISVGRVENTWMVDMDYSEDSTAKVDLNVVWSDEGLVEVQGTAERAPFSPAGLAEAVSLARPVIQQLFQAQKEALEA